MIIVLNHLSIALHFSTESLNLYPLPRVQEFIALDQLFVLLTILSK